nr:caspase-14 isoform X3 [Rattus norvegicus]
MAFLVSGTLQAAAQLVDAWDSLGRKGKYSVQGSRAALILCSPGVSARAVAAMDGVLQALGFENYKKRQVLVQLFCRIAEESAENTYCPIFRTSFRGTLCLGDGPWRPESDPGPSTQYDLSGTRAALLLAVFQDRLGARHDVTALRDLCQALGFKVTLRTNPSAQAFREELAEFRKKLDTHKGPVSCALVALMAHGGPQGQLLGADGEEVQPEVLVQELSCCQALHGHPKIFLFQACRGGYRDPGVGPRALPWYRHWLRAPPAIPTQADVLQIHADAPGSLLSTPGGSGQADILTVYAAAEGQQTGV